ncbi:hypothetical protein PB2503_04007 [Parvularcula bermudensis HTCC2503]|uniref:Thioesterase domain-containing protein n=1 Tax=Parvularcula bermudensis (strain ATCC BAA-594 / HTCC2503 / KCTC 12087) TaxID=314260 RepID=E0TE55_PARBH|nr:thioesterase family protein [Parvularcula bermudensis]ADM08876.1 hypothetical protein PB2503_04007 [Parvularcula bermudensis HTCC2503]
MTNRPDPDPTAVLRGAISDQTAVISHRRPEPADIDALGHVNNAVYVRWIQDAAVAHWLGIADAEMSRRYVWICLRHEVDYREPVLPDQEVEIRTWLGALKGPRFKRHTEIKVNGSARWSVRAETIWVLLNAETRRPERRVPKTILDAFGLNEAALPVFP